MPWKETCPVLERYDFINDWLEHRGSLSGLCRAYSISPKTGWKWIRRFKEHGKSGLEECSRASHNHPNATSARTIALVISARQAHPIWGPRKLREGLQARYEGHPLPAASTIGDILKRSGLVKPRKRGRGLHGRDGNTADYAGANNVWCIDYKGQFKLGNGQMCYPLTVTDGYSRLILCCQCHNAPKEVHVRTAMESAFRKYCLPRAIRSDNGTPFASTGAGRLTALSNELVEVADGRWRVKFCGMELATYDERRKRMKLIGSSGRVFSRAKKYNEKVSPMRPA